MERGYIIVSFKVKKEARENKSVRILLESMVDTLADYFEDTIHSLEKISKYIDISVEPMLVDEEDVN